MNSQEDKKPFHEDLTDNLIVQLSTNFAPFQKASSNATTPFNPSTGKAYKGVNRLNLAMSEFSDPRWFTFKQAKEEGYKINKGAKAQTVIYYQFSKDNEPLERPIMRFAKVFNAEQLSNVPELENPLEKTQKQVQSPKKVIEEYLNKDGKRAISNEDHARKNLRTELALWMLENESGIANNLPKNTQHIATWINILKKDPNEIMRACRDAEKAKDFAMEHRQEQMVEKPQEQQQAESSKESKRAKEKTFLSVPFEEKDNAKAQGAKWDWQSKAWFIPAGEDLSKVEHWLPQNQEKTIKKEHLSPEEEIAIQLKELGLDIEGLPILDGSIQRVPLIGRDSKGLDGAYCGYSDGVPAAWAQNFVTGEKVNIKATGHVLSDEEKALQRAENAQKQQKREAERKEMQDRVAIQCTEKWDKSHYALSEHPYLIRKNVSAINIKEDSLGKTLLLPLVNTSGEIRGLQEIDEEGNKRFTKGMEKKGNFCPLGFKMADSPKQILLCEGYATGASLHKATELPIAVAFDSGNLEEVAINLRKKFPKAELVICADNDIKNEKNVGVEKAKAAAEKVDAKVKIPKFSKEEQAKGCNDFNDMHTAKGIKEVQKQIGLSKEKSQEGITR